MSSKGKKKKSTSKFYASHFSGGPTTPAAVAERDAFVKYCTRKAGAAASLQSLAAELAAERKALTVSHKYRRKAAGAKWKALAAELAAERKALTVSHKDRRKALKKELDLRPLKRAWRVASWDLKESHKPPGKRKPCPVSRTYPGALNSQNQRRKREIEPLGNNTGFVAASVQGLSDRERVFHLRRAAAHLVGGRTGGCGVCAQSHLVPGGKGQRVQRDTVDIVLAERWVRDGRPATGEKQRWKKRDKAHYSGLAHCNDIWVCPVCASKIKRERGEQVAQVVEHLQGDGKAIYKIDFTVPHYFNSDANDVVRMVAEGFRYMRQQRAFRAWQKRYGYFGDMRALEVTHGRNGWHPHLHTLFVLDKKLSTRGERVCHRELSELWAATAKRMKWYSPSEERGVKFEFCACPDNAARYAIGNEMSSGITKAGKRGSRTPFQILADFSENPNQDDAELFRQYAAAFCGAKHLTWSDTLRRYRELVVGSTQTDEAVGNKGVGGLVYAGVRTQLWNDIQLHLKDAAFLDYIDSGPRTIVHAARWLARTLQRQIFLDFDSMSLDMGIIDATGEKLRPGVVVRGVEPSYLPCCGNLRQDVPSPPPVAKPRVVREPELEFA